MTVLVSHVGHVRTFTLSNPGRKNALRTETFAQLEQACSDAAADSDVRVVLVRGAGGDFCSGADLSEPSEGRDHWLPYMRMVGRACLALHQLPRPVVARVEGVAVGGGLNVALACDLVVAATDARLSEVFVQRGLSPDFGGSFVLPRLVGLHKAKQLAFLGDMLTAAEAAEIGIVNWVVAPDEMDSFVDGLVARLASAAPLALSLTKGLLNASLGSSLPQALEAEAAAQALNFSTDDTREAIRAFRQRRAPDFHSR